MRERQGALRQTIRAEVDMLTERYQEEIGALEAMRGELSELTIPDLTTYEPEPAGPEDVTGDSAGFNWLYDSDRDYFEQIAAYKRSDGLGETN